MRKQSLFALLLLAGFNQVGASPYVTDTTTVDDAYNADTVNLSIPLIDFDTGRFSSDFTFNSFEPQSDGSLLSTITINSLEPLYDSNSIVMDDGFDPTIAANLETFLNRHITDLKKPGVILRVEIDGKVWRGVAGKRRVNSTELLNYSDRHRLGSLTKTFVDNVVMQLVHEGVLNLDATIATYLPDIQIPNKDTITIRHMVSHRSGLFNYVLDFDFTGIQKALEIDPLKVYTPDELIAISNAQPVNNEPGTAYSYSNTNLIIIGKIIEQVTGKSIIENVHDRIIKPLSLKRTEFPIDPGIQSNYMHGHADYNCDGVLSSYNDNTAPITCVNGNNENVTLPALAASEIVSYLDPSASWAAGAMISNHEDLAKWMKAYVDGTLLNDTALQNQILGDCMTSSAQYGASYCLGVVKLTWPIDTTDSTQWWYGHLGQINGYDNAVFRNPSKNITVGMTNNNYFIYTPVDEGTGVLIFELLQIVDPQTSGTTSARAMARGGNPINPQALGGE